MSAPESQDIETATTALETAPDSHTRRYDRQLRLWAASGQAALENARVLVISASATSSSILKNLVLPGVGHFTILDAENVTARDVGNNFFLHHTGIGKPRASESVKYLSELNENVQGVADISDLAVILSSSPEYFKGFTIVIAHNLRSELLDKLSTLLWADQSGPSLIVVRSAGFLADFSLQFHEHTVVDSHTDDQPSLRLDNPFPALKKHSLELDFDALDVTDHSHIPYFVILVRALDDWKKAHDGHPPEYKQLQEFKRQILAMKKKDDEENFDEAYSQVFKAYRKTTVPGSISSLFELPQTQNLDANSSPFFIMLRALQIFTQSEPFCLPLSPTLPDIKSDTRNYIHLQNLYKAQANDEKSRFTAIVRDLEKGGAGSASGEGQSIPTDLIDEFVKNSHQLRVLSGKRFGDEDAAASLGAILSNPAQVATHLALSSLSAFEASQGRYPVPGSEEDGVILRKQVDEKLASIGWNGDESQLHADEAATGPAILSFKEYVDNAIGEIVRSPTAELPTTAALLGGLIAQETIKLITRQYVPVDGVCVVDLIASSTGILKL